MSVIIKQSNELLLVFYQEYLREPRGWHLFFLVTENFVILPVRSQGWEGGNMYSLVVSPEEFVSVPFLFQALEGPELPEGPCGQP